MRIGLICIPVLLLSALVFAADKTVAPPIAPSYASSRALRQSQFLRLDWTDSSRHRVIPVKIYYPTGAAGPFPVIIFSHGLGGTREGYEYLARQWAGNGYICVHLQHPGSDDSAWRGQAHPMESLRRAANNQNALARAEDVHFAIDQLMALNRDNPLLKGRLALDRIGMAGHSFGAQTTLLDVGQRMGSGRLQKDPRIKAAIAMSPPVPKLDNQFDSIYANIKLPLFIMTGTKDDSPIGETSAARRRIPFDHLHSTPAYLMTLSGGDHMVFSGRLAPRPGDEQMQKLIRLASTAFWDSTLKDDPAARAWLDDGGLKKVAGERAVIEEKLGSNQE